MVNIKLKYTLEEANEIIKRLASSLPENSRTEYAHYSGVPYSTLMRYLRKGAPTPVAANHLAAYMEDYTKKNPVAA